MARGLMIFATALLLCGAALALAAQEDWEPDLVWQLAAEQNCILKYLTNVIERSVNDTELVFARAHCDDGRAFDAIREGLFAQFTFEPCQLDIREC